MNNGWVPILRVVYLLQFIVLLRLSALVIRVLQSEGRYQKSTTQPVPFVLSVTVTFLVSKRVYLIFVFSNRSYYSKSESRLRSPTRRV